MIVIIGATTALIANHLIANQGDRELVLSQAPLRLDFSTMDDWQVIDDSQNPSRWNFNFTTATQQAFVGNWGDALYMGNHLGTFVHLDRGFGLQNYRFDLTITPNSPLGEEFGIMVYYQDPENYYRFVNSYVQGYSRLEKRVKGHFELLAQNAIGLVHGHSANISVELVDQTITVRIDGKPWLVATDDSLSSGTIALYTRDQTLFEDLTLTSKGSESIPEIVKQTASRDASTILTIGDSNTWGEGDSFEEDGLAVGGRMRSKQGFQANLADALTRVSGQIQVIYNESVRGDTLVKILESRLATYLAYHSDANTVVIMAGTNDVRQDASLPSGLNCAKAACRGTFKGRLKELIDILAAFEKQTVIVQIPPIFGGSARQDPWTQPDRYPINLKIEQFNKVIRGEDEHPLEGYVVGPGLYQYFLGEGHTRRDLFADNFHLNSLGHAVLAIQLLNTLHPEQATPLPFVIDDLCIRYSAGDDCADPSPYQQELRGKGNALYVDRKDVVLEAVDERLSGGRWLMTADADAIASNGNYLSFNLDRDATVYVAYPAETQLPSWLNEHEGFIPTSIAIASNHPEAGEFQVFARDFPAGHVELGGADARHTDAAANYAVIVKAKHRFTEHG